MSVLSTVWVCVPTCKLESHTIGITALSFIRRKVTCMYISWLANVKKYILTWQLVRTVSTKVVWLWHLAVKSTLNETKLCSHPEKVNCILFMIVGSGGCQFIQATEFCIMIPNVVEFVNLAPTVLAKCWSIKYFRLSEST